MRRFDLIPIHIDGIAQRLEGVEADAHRKQNVERHPIQLKTKGLKQRFQILAEEIIILVQAEDEQVQRNIGGTDPFLFLPIPLRLLQHQPAAKAAKRGQSYQQQKTPIPPTIEQITGRHDKQVLPTQGLEHEPIEQKHYRQKH